MKNAYFIEPDFKLRGCPNPLPALDSSRSSADTRPRMMTLGRIRGRVGALLLVAFFAPLLASGAAAALDDCCPNCPPPPVTSDNEPCHGSPLLVCCDDVATTESGQRIQVRARAAHAVPFVAALSQSQPVALCASQDPPDLSWSTSVLRRSVVLRI